MPRNIIHSDISMDPESASEPQSPSPEEEEQDGGDVDVEEDDEDGEEEVDAEELEDEEQVDVDDPPPDATDMDELSSPSATPPPVTKSPSRTRLKITLKLPQQKPKRSARARAPPTPTPDASRTGSRDIDIESEDDDDDDEVIGGSGRPLTARQAVLASVVDSSHVSLSAYGRTDEGSRKKKQLNEAELALRREETARKRKHLSEKKLQDEKAETINRLLKKQSRARGKRNALATADDRTPGAQTGAAGTGTPVEGDPDEEMEPPVPVYEEAPKMYRWISTSRPPAAPSTGATPELKDEKEKEGGEAKTMTLAFCVPVSALSSAPLVDEAEKMDVDTVPSAPKADAPHRPSFGSHKWTIPCGLEIGSKARKSKFFAVSHRSCELPGVACCQQLVLAILAYAATPGNVGRAHGTVSTTVVARGDEQWSGKYQMAAHMTLA
ncbi:hypothetical protein FA95DRAFT_1598111 [Auriscalpium vulgare]|uniref:Uncharacterized protein n=1 Tax=Auriscalpium vulgare TaxID=40419 RepID=A0ACB8RHW5_9AGAM|nr:hypothetical protein FA95DRAFT_1598111 [Auriscalpium vulgare]